MMDFFNSRFVKARKEHNCECCNNDIHKGEYYFRECGKFYGDFFDRCLCITCHEVMSEFASEVDNEFSWDQIQEYAQNECCDYCGFREDDCMFESCFSCPKIIDRFVDKHLWKYLPEEYKEYFPHDLLKELQYNLCDGWPLKLCREEWYCREEDKKIGKVPCPVKKLAWMTHHTTAQLVTEVLNRITKEINIESEEEKLKLNKIIQHYQGVVNRRK